MWISTAGQKLRTLESAVLQHGLYVERIDALSLSTIDIADEVAAPQRGYPIPSAPSSSHSGLNRLVSTLTSILQEANIEEQGHFMHLKSEFDKCKALHEKSFVESQMFDGQNVFEEVIRVQGKDSAEQFKIVAKQLHRWLQDLHDSAISVLDTKLRANEVIHSSLESYARYLAVIAEEAGVSKAITRANAIVKPQQRLLLSHRFLDTSEYQELLLAIRQLFATAFCDNDISLAERKLLYNHASVQRATDATITNIKMGAGLTLLLWSFSECFNNEQSGRAIWKDPTFAIFMCFGDLLLLLWMWGVSINVWRSTGIDFLRLLKLEETELNGPRVPETIVFASATDISIIFLVVFICFNKAARGVFNLPSNLVTAHALPALMVAFFIYRIIVPTASRRRWLAMLWNVLAAPWYPVSFRDGYIGDLLTSLVRVMLPMCFSFAYLLMSALSWLSNDLRLARSTSNLWWQDSLIYKVVLEPLIILLPLWIRLVQCLRRSVESGKRWPHMANALKYTSAIAVISFGTFRPNVRNDPVWVTSFVCATIYQYTWDLTMDWGFFVWADSHKASERSCFGISMRKTRLLGPTWIYVVVSLVNLLLRFAWTATLIPEERIGSEGESSVYSLFLAHLAPLIAAGEVLRRMVWGFFRLEYEQLEVFGSPDVSSVLDISSSLNNFEKMDLSNVEVDTTHDNPGKINDQTSEWINAHPILTHFADLISNFSTLDETTSTAQRARYVEAVIFSSFVALIIVTAAAPHFAFF